jgi:integrase
LSAIATKNGPVEANRVRASLSAFYAWCLREGLAAQNLVVGTGRRQEKSRDRVLTLAELKTLWNATSGTDDYSAILRLLTLTGSRISEMAGLAWSEIHEDKIVLPAARTKNAREHSIPLTAPMRAILDARPRRGEFVFGAREGRPFSGRAKSQYYVNARIAAAGESLAPWTPHDLRRSCATGMAELGIQPHIIEAVLNHASGHRAGVAGIYNRASYETEKRQALTLWSEHLLAVVEGRAAKVVPLRSA